MNPQGNQPTLPNPGFVPYIPPEQQSGYYSTFSPEPYREQPVPARENQWIEYSSTPASAQYIPPQQSVPLQQGYRVPMEPIVVTKMTHHYNNATPMTYPNAPPGYYYPSATMTPVSYPNPGQSGAGIPYAIPVGTPYSYTVQTNPSSPYVYMPSSTHSSTENSETDKSEQNFGEKAVNTAKSISSAVGNACKEFYVCITIEIAFINNNKL